MAAEKRSNILKFAAAILVFAVVCFIIFGGLTATAEIRFQIAPVLATSLAEGKNKRYSSVLADVDGVHRLMVAPVEYAMLEPGDLVCVRRANFIAGLTKYSIASDIFCPKLQRQN
jgi:hypothetical protein